MPVNIEKIDIRSIKTERALSVAMFQLLETYSFRKISVMAICEEALISRAAFYAHFTDKYDFLKWWIINTWPDDIYILNDTDRGMEKKVNQLIYNNKILIRNMFMDADTWTLDTIFDALYFILRLTADKAIDGSANPKYIVLSNFYIGGMIYYILWQVKNNFPQNVEMMNEHLNKLIKTFKEWNE